MFGYRERFHYQECGQCGALSLLDPPADFGQYYPTGYGSLTSPQRTSGLRRFVKARRLAAARGRHSWVGRCALKWRGEPTFLSWLRPLDVDLHDPVVDVGCGDGALLLDMNSCGFTDLQGLDPIIPGDLHYPGHVTIRKADVLNLRGRFRLVMLHHALEHMFDPLGILRHLSACLADDGTLLLRLPLADSLAYRTYGANWFQIDAPRHVTIHTRRSLTTLAERAGLSISHVLYDSTAAQFWASEQYAHDIPLSDPRSHAVDPARSRFSAGEVAEFERRARELNARQDGDQVCIYLRKSSDRSASERSGRG